MPVSGLRGSERGFTLIELLVAMTLMLVILGAVLTSFNGFANTSRRNTILQDQMDVVRGTMDQVVRQARNLANPTTGAGAGATPTTIAAADPYKLIFQTTDPSKQWVSYCLDDTSPRGKLYYQTSAVAGLTPAVVADTTASGMANGCPSQASNWQKTVKVADYVTNRIGSRPIFTYYPTTGNSALTPPIDQSITPTITRIRMSIFLDVDTAKPPAEVQLASGAFMRNQNQRPTALFVTKAGTADTYTFDAGDSTDPEQRTLQYDWYAAPTSTSTLPAANAVPSCLAAQPTFPTAPAAGSGWSCLGSDVVLTHTFPSGTLPTYVFLRVTDPGNLQTLSSFASGNTCLSLSNTSRTESQCIQLP